MAFISDLLDEYRADPRRWENNGLDEFVDALAAWVNDSSGYYADAGMPELSQLDWAWLALALQAATGYE